MTRSGLGRNTRRALGVAAILLGAWATSTIAASPPNDSFVNATSLTGLTNLIASNAGATAEPNEPNHAAELPQSTIWWTWTVPFTGTFSIITSNSLTENNLPLDTVAAVYTGNSLSNLIGVSANDDTSYGEFGALWSRCIFRAYAGETLRIAVGSLGTTGLIRLSVDVAGTPMAPWEAVGLDGNPVRSSTFSGQVIMIDFWDTICTACIEEVPALIRLQTTLFPRGFTIVGLSGDTVVADVADYVTDHHVNYPIAMSTLALQIHLVGGSVGYPTKLLVDREGRIVERYEGGNTEKGYRTLIDPLMRPDPRPVITVARTPGQIVIRWAAVESGFLVERASGPGGGPWTTANVTPILSDGQYTVSVPTGAESEFFRLKKP